MRPLDDERETCSGASDPGLQSQPGHSCMILRRLPSLSEPHLFSSNVEQPGSRGPSSAVSYAVGMGEGGSVDGFRGRAGSGAEPARAPGCFLDSWNVGWAGCGQGFSPGWWMGSPLGTLSTTPCPFWPDCPVCLLGLAQASLPSYNHRTFISAGNPAWRSTLRGRWKSVFYL